MRVVRAGEAKLRGRMTIDVLIAGPPGCEYPCVVKSGFALCLCRIHFVLKVPGVFYGLSFILYGKEHGFLGLSMAFVDRCIGFVGAISKLL